MLANFQAHKKFYFIEKYKISLNYLIYRNIKNYVMKITLNRNY